MVGIPFSRKENARRSRRSDPWGEPPLRLPLLGSLRAHLAVLQRPSRSRSRGAPKRCTLSKPGQGELAELAHLVADAIVNAHLATMLRLNIQYDVLPRESEILHLQVLGRRLRTAERAQRDLLRNRRQEQRLLGDAIFRFPRRRTRPTKTAKSSCARTAPSPTSARTSPISSGSSVCSARTFYYRPLTRYTDGQQVWVSTDQPQPAPAPAFGHGAHGL